jgi:hypothetical protein
MPEVGFRKYLEKEHENIGPGDGHHISDVQPHTASNHDNHHATGSCSHDDLGNS